MKFVAAMLFVFSGTAMACPELSGLYLCDVEGQTQKMWFQQQTENGIVTYNYNDFLPFVADNVTYDYDDGFMTEGTTRSWCEGNTLKTHLAGKVAEGDLEYLMSWTKEGNSLHHTMEGSLKTENDVEYITVNVTCTKTK